MEQSEARDGVTPCKRDTEESGEDEDLQEQVKCLFCYEPARNFDGNRATVTRKVMVKTSERMFGYVCKHLEFNEELHELMTSRRSKKEKHCRLLPGNLPLCVGCKGRYYQKMYDAFVEFELAMDKLHDLISACVTKPIATSAKRNGESWEGGGNRTEETFGTGQPEEEHGVMKLVRQFRGKVFEKNPTGWVEETRGEPKAGPSSSIPAEQRPSSSVPSIGVENVVKVVKSSIADTFRTAEERQKETCDRLLEVKRETEDDVAPSFPNSSKSRTMKYYAVAEPAPGVIQIIPMTTTGKKVIKLQKRREPEYLDRRVQQNTCNFCNLLFRNRLQLIKHKVEKHGMEKPVKCQKCEYRCYDKPSLTRHMETHSENRESLEPFICSQCGKQFKTKSAIKTHSKIHAANRQLYICEVCGKQFKNSESRRFCMKRHNGLKLFQCSFAGCDKRFVRKQVLKVHEISHTGDKPHKCDACGKCFSQRTPLAIHFKRKHSRESNIPRE